MVELFGSRFAHPDDNKFGGLAFVLDIHQLPGLPEALNTVNPCAPTADVPSVGSLLEWVPFGVRAGHFHQEANLASFFPSLTDGKSPGAELMCVLYTILSWVGRCSCMLHFSGRVT
jgi:hypothetical protein